MAETPTSKQMTRAAMRTLPVRNNISDFLNDTHEGIIKIMQIFRVKNVQKLCQ